MRHPAPGGRGGPVSLRVVVVDDQSMVRAGLRALLESDGDIEVVAEASDGEQALRLTERHRPDVVLMDVRMPVCDGITATRRIREDPGLDGSRVVVLTTFDSDEHLFDAIAAGASGFLLKDCEPGELRQAVRTVADGHALLAPAVTERVMRKVVVTEGSPPPSDAVDAVASLTAREREVLALVGRGLSNGEIGAELVISPDTARTHVSRLLVKLDRRDRIALVVLAHEARLV